MPTQAVSTRVLVVDDEASDALWVKRSLRADPASQPRFEVRHAATLAQGLEQLRREPVDVLLLDLALPDSDGPDTVARLRDREPSVPLVVFTGSDDVALAARAFAAGADEYLVKTDLDAQVLQRTLRHAIERRRLRAHAGAPPVLAPPPDLRHRELLHDLRNLLTLILGNAQLLQEDAAERPGLRARAEALLRASRLAVELIERSHAPAAPARSPADGVDLSTFVRRAIPLLRSALPERIRLRLDLPAGLPPVEVKAERLFHSLVELMVNAVEAIGDGAGTLEVRTGATVLDEADMNGLIAPGGCAAGPHVWLEVRDTGRGFDLGGVFGLMAPGVSTKGAGHGYGLSHLEEMLAEHRAALRVRSQVGAGAAFCVLFPGRLGS